MALTNYSMLGRRVGWAEVPATDRATLSDAWCLGPSSCTDNGNLRLCAPLRLKLPSSDGPAHPPFIYFSARPYSYVYLVYLCPCHWPLGKLLGYRTAHLNSLDFRIRCK